MDDFVPIGEVVKALGLKGEVKLYPLLDYFEPLLDSGFLVWQEGDPVRVRSHRRAGQMPALRMQACDTRDQAEALVGRLLGFRRASYLEPAFPRPAGGLPFRYLGREVVTGTGRLVGTVDEVRLAGGQFLLVIPADGAEILIPAVEPILRPTEGLAGPLVIDPPEGLLDVHRG